MAKHGRGKGRYKKYNSRFQALPVNAGLSLGTLADGLTATFSLTAIADDFWVQSTDLAWSIDGLTQGQGSLAVGIANGDLSGPEITEAINAVPTSRSDIVNRELARRPVRRVGQFAGDSEEKLGDGKVIRTTVKMYLAEGVELNAWINNGSGSALTTGAELNVFGVIFGEWR